LQDLLALDAHYAGAIDWSELQHRAQQFGYGALFKNYLYSAARVAGLRSSSSMVSTSRQRAYFASCRASIRWALPGRVFALLDRFSGFQIRRIYGERQSVLSATLNRARVLYSMLRGVGARRIR
jgi:hypothetical protein